MGHYIWFQEIILQGKIKFDKIKRRRLYGKSEEAPGGKIHGILYG